MRPPRRRIDNVQNGIVAALRGVGASVTVTSALGNGFPDLVCGLRNRTVLIECKSDKGDQLTLDERNWHDAWRGGPLVVVRTAEEALWAMGIETGEDD